MEEGNAKLLSQHQALNQKEKGESHWRMTPFVEKPKAKRLKNQTSTEVKTS